MTSELVGFQTTQGKGKILNIKAENLKYRSRDAKWEKFKMISKHLANVEAGSVKHVFIRGERKKKWVSKCCKVLKKLPSLADQWMDLPSLILLTIKSGLWVHFY